MIDIDAPLSFLYNQLWEPDVGAFKEAVSIDITHLNDNYLAWIVMKKHDPDRATIMKEQFLKDYLDQRWCILDGDRDNFKPSPTVLANYFCYADLITLEFLNLKAWHQFPQADLHFGMVSKIYGLNHKGYIYDKATAFEGYTMYKLCLFALCAIAYNYGSLAKELVNTIS